MRTGLSANHAFAFIAWLTSWAPVPAKADMAFHIVEVIREHEVRPWTDYHTVRWEGDYYIGQDGVTLVGWGRKNGLPRIPYDVPALEQTPQGNPFTYTFHRLPNGLDTRTEYGSFVVTRHLVQTGPDTCTDDVNIALKPGYHLFEVRRIRNSEPMSEDTRVYVVHRCELPRLSS